MERPENSHKLYFIYAPLRPSLFNPSVLTQFWRKKNIIVEQGSAFNKTSLSVCCAVILLHHTLLLLHGPHLEEIQKCRNTEMQKYRNTEIQKHKMQSRYCTALYFCFTALISVGFGNVAPNTDAEKLYAIVMMLLGCEWQANSQLVLMFWVASRIEDSCKTFWSSPLMWSIHPPTHQPTTIWLSLSLFVVVT